ncbi:hypothetical protein KQI61_15410 [Anaerocolumna aminovalerica]|uniref:hypothetical protein n=1 Tax=Anaerocolumna aminovalerica TaxID=1527 RepID=UPI001C0F063F|nr:hypothetical protein [Anaerocolumna aminovalerica]
MNKLRVWHIPQVGCSATFYIPVATLEEGKKVIDILAAYDLFQLENNIKPDFANVSGLQMFNEEDQEWEDWYLETDEEYYDDVDEYFENDDKMQQFDEELFNQLKC